MIQDITMVRIYIHEAEQGPHTRLMREIMSVLRDQHAVKGFTVFRGIAGMGASGEKTAADLLRLSGDLPLVIEFFDEPAVAEAAMKLLDPLVPKGHIVHWPASCLCNGQRQDEV